MAAQTERRLSTSVVDVNDGKTTILVPTAAAVRRVVADGSLCRAKDCMINIANWKLLGEKRKEIYFNENQSDRFDDVCVLEETASSQEKKVLKDTIDSGIAITKNGVLRKRETCIIKDSYVCEDNTEEVEDPVWRNVDTVYERNSTGIGVETGVLVSETEGGEDNVKIDMSGHESMDNIQACDINISGRMFDHEAQECKSDAETTVVCKQMPREHHTFIKLWKACPLSVKLWLAVIAFALMMYMLCI